MSERDFICAFAEKLDSSYRPVLDFPGYFLREDGTTYSGWTTSRDDKGQVVRKWAGILTKLAPQKNQFGYSLLRISNGGKKIHCMLSRAMLLAFVGPPPFPKACACHNDGNKDNNHISNLRWDTRSGNEKDKVSHGTSNRGERNGMLRYSESLVRKVRELHKQFPVSKDGKRYGSHKAIAAELGLPIVAVRGMVNGNWKHLDV